MWTEVHWATGIFPKGSAPAERLKTTALLGPRAHHKKLYKTHMLRFYSTGSKKIVLER